MQGLAADVGCTGTLGDPKRPAEWGWGGGGWGALTGLESSRTRTAHHAGVKRVPESPVVSVISKGSYSYRHSLSFCAFILKPDSSFRYKSILVDLKEIKRVHTCIKDVWGTFHQGYDSMFLVSNPNLTDGKTQTR